MQRFLLFLECLNINDIDYHLAAWLHKLQVHKRIYMCVCLIYTMIVPTWKSHSALNLNLLGLVFFLFVCLFLFSFFSSPCCYLKDFCWLYYKAKCLLQQTEDSIMPSACQTKLMLWTGSKLHWQLATIHQKLKWWEDENKRDSICINNHGTLPEWWRYSGNTLSSSPWSGPERIWRQKMGKKGVNE